MVASVSDLQRLWHLASFVTSQTEHHRMPAAAQLAMLQSSVQSKLDSLQHPTVMTELPYTTLRQLHHSLLDLLQSAEGAEATDPFPQLASICAKAQEDVDCIRAHVDPIGTSSTSLLNGWSVFWGIALHSGIKLPATLHSKSSQMAGEPATVTSAAVHAFTSLCSATHGLPDDSDDLKFLLHFVTQDSALFQGHLMARLKMCAEEQSSAAIWPGKAMGPSCRPLKFTISTASQSSVVKRALHKCLQFALCIL